MNKQILRHIIRYILIILIIIVCATIFRFSSEQGKKSENTSGKVARIIVMLNKDNRQLPEYDIQLKIEQLQYIIRKTAHFSIYMLLGILLICCAKTFDGNDLMRFDISIILAFLYACSDEFHQMFVPGRSPQFRDVCIDTTGAFVGVLLVLLIYKIITMVKDNKKKNPKDIKEIENKTTTKKHVLFVASTGGHLNELMQVKPLFNKYEYHIITEKNKVDKSLKDEYKDKLRFLIYGTKKYPIRYFFKFTANCFISLYYFLKFQPEVIVTTGTHTAVPMCYIAKIFGSKVIFIETFANRTTRTVAGRLVYPIADTFVVQWDEMQKVYPKAVCWGWIY